MQCFCLQAPFKVTARKSLTPPSERNLKLQEQPAVKISPKSSPRQSREPSPKPLSQPSSAVTPKLLTEQSVDELPTLSVSPKLEPVSLDIAPVEEPPELSQELPLDALANTQADIVISTEEPLSVKESPKSSAASSPKSSPKHSPLHLKASPERFEAKELLQEIDDKFADTPAVLSTRRAVHRPVKIEPDAEPTETSENVKNLRKFEVPAIKLEIEEYVPEPTPSTPTRTRRKVKESSAEPMTPTRSSRRLKERETNVEQTEVQTPTRSTRRGKKDENAAVTPTRLRGKKVKEEAEVIEQMEVETPKPFSRRAKEAVQESLQQIADEIEAASPSKHSRGEKEAVQESLEQISGSVDDHIQKIKATPKRGKDRKLKQTKVTEPQSPIALSPKAKEAVEESVQKLTEEMLDTIWEREHKSPDDSSPNRLTRIKVKDRVSMSPTPSSPLVQTAQVTLTPTRMSRRLKDKENLVEPAGNEESLARTPPRGRRGRKTMDTAQSPAVERKVTDKLITPFRGRRKKIENSNNSAEFIEKESKSPSRNKTIVSGDKSPAKVEIDSVDNVETAQTPTRGRRKKKENKTETDDISLLESSALTPTRRSSRLKKETVDELGLPLGQKESFSHANLDFDGEFMETDSDGPRTRRRSFGRADKISEKFSDTATDVQNVRRHSFSRSQKTKEHILGSDHYDGVSTRRHTIGISGFKIESENLGKKSSRKVSPVREQIGESTPVTTPSRRGRPRKKDVSPVAESIKEESDNEMKSEKGTLSRRGRGRKDTEVKAEIDSKIETDSKETQIEDRVTVSKKNEESEAKVELSVGPEPKSTPSRTKRQKIDKKAAAPFDSSKSPEKEIIHQSFAALVEGKI